jgi:genome maintenance exonuclease 1
MVNNFKKFVHKPLLISEQSLEEVSKDGKRFYSTPEGLFPSVTTVVGFEKQQFFSEWRKNNPEESKRVTTRGTKFHSIIESYLNNEDINLDDLFPNYKSLFLLLKPELDKIDNIAALETPLWSKILGLAGRTDCIAEYDGKLSIIDFKASSKEKRAKDIDNYFAQATAYALMYQERTGIIVDNFAILIACEDGIKQVFQGNPMAYVKQLKTLITKYRKVYGIPSTENITG